MARTVRDTNLSTRASRLRLKVRHEPYWRALETGLALGYRRRSSGGTWIARRRTPTGSYIEHKLATADDLHDADGVAALNFSQAQVAARSWWQAQRRHDEGHASHSGPFTVADAVRDYLKILRRRGSKSVIETERKARTHILPALGSLLVTKLTAKQISDWHHGLAEQPALARSTPGKERNLRKVEKGPEANRKRRATANRLLTVLKAALNHAWKSGNVDSDDAWRRVQPFRAVEAARIRYLTEAECQRIVNASEPSFRNLVRGALLTGCRYSELTRLQVADFNKDSGTITVRESKSGKPRHVILTIEGREFLLSVTVGKSGSALIFDRPDGGMWRTSHQLRRMNDASRNARIEPPVSFHVLRHTHGSMLAMRGVPLAVIAQQLGHADTRMTEKHYAHLAPSYVAETIRSHFPKLGIMNDNGVSVLKRKVAK